MLAGGTPAVEVRAHAVFVTVVPRGLAGPQEASSGPSLRRAGAELFRCDRLSRGEAHQSIQPPVEKVQESAMRRRPGPEGPNDGAREGMAGGYWNVMQNCSERTPSTAADMHCVWGLRPMMVGL